MACDAIMGIYHHCVFPYLLDFAMGSRVFDKPRQAASWRSALAQAGTCRTTRRE
jgi:hypothetical protein